MFTWYEFILLFVIYAFIGWLWEVLISFIQYRRFINRGFLIGPYIPIYGFGGQIATLFFSSLAVGEGLRGVLITVVSTGIICSILEYFTSFIMEKIFNNRWWDYSDMPLNINGRICLIYSIAFGIGCTLTLRSINPGIRYLYDLIHLNQLSGIILIIIFSIIIFTDTGLSFNIIAKFKGISNKVKEDSTEKITTEVKKTVLEKYNILYRRLVDSFPDMKVYNKYLINKFNSFREFNKNLLKKRKRH